MSMSILDRIRRIRSSVPLVLVALAFAAQSAAAATPNVQIVTVPSGIVILNLDKGTVTGCSVFALAGLPPTPSGSCGSLGSVGASAAGFTANASGDSVFIINKTSGAIYQCVFTMLASNGKPYGACKNIASAASL